MTGHPDELRIGTEVFSNDGHKLGELRRLVLRRKDLRVSHVVVDIGFLRSGHKLWEGGFGLDYDRVVRVDELALVSDKRVELKLTAAAFKDAPEYSTESYEAPQDLSPDEFDIPDVVNRAQGLVGMLTNTSGVWLVEKLNKPLDSVDVSEGTPVWRMEPHEKLGEIGRVLLHPDSGRVRAFVLRRGLIARREIVLPVRYVTELFDDLVRVDIDDDDLEQLREYNGD